ncbi:phosphatase PAP2 family protein [Patescibacteria group bacterium]|nr:phosphatase PAP2 family protein [Patescibacteria group bacterium]
MNNAIFYFFYNFAHKSAFVDGLITFFAVYFPYLVIIIAGLFVLFHHEVIKAENPWQVLMQKKKEILRVFIYGLVAWIVAYVFKILIHTDRPFVKLSNVQNLFPETGFAFPSGHATFFAALAFSIFFYHKKVGYWFMGFALIIGLARIAGGVHFPIDILGGFALGGLVAYLLKNV